MACQLPSGDVNGISDPAICARHGGTWIPEPSLMNTDDFGNPLTQAQADTNFAGTTNWETARDRAAILQEANLFADRTPKVNADYYKNIFTPKPDEKEPWRSGLSVGEAYDKSKEWWGNVPVIGPAYKSVYETAFEPADDFGKVLDTIVDPELRQAALQYINENEASTLSAAAFTAYLEKKFKPLRKVWDKVKKRYQPTKERLKKKSDGSVETIQEATPGKSKLSDAAKLYVGTNLALKTAEEQKANLFGQVPTDKTVVPKVTDDDLLRKPKVDPNADVRKGRQGPLTQGGLFDVSPDEVKTAGAEKDIPDSIWERMQTKDYWLKGIEGGAGGWDNRLFRLGEMMAYMGTPLSKRGDSPAKRWTTAAKDSQKALKDASILAGKQLTAKQKRWKDALPTLSNLETQYMKEPSEIFGSKKPGVKEKANAAAKANLHLQIAHQLIANDIEPSRERVRALLAKYLEELNKKPSK